MLFGFQFLECSLDNRLEVIAKIFFFSLLPSISIFLQSKLSSMNFELNFNKKFIKYFIKEIQNETTNTKGLFSKQKIKENDFSSQISFFKIYRNSSEEILKIKNDLENNNNNIKELQDEFKKKFHSYGFEFINNEKIESFNTIVIERVHPIFKALFFYIKELNESVLYENNNLNNNLNNNVLIINTFMYFMNKNNNLFLYLFYRLRNDLKYLY
jgi:hypothetical protein